MTQVYSDPTSEDDEYALPGVEVFYMSKADIADAGWQNYHDGAEPGWYWWACFPGCLPDGDPMGPFETIAEAIEDAQNA